MKKLLITLLVGLTPILLFAEGISTAGIAELAAHRIDRLVTTGKIDASFNARVERIEISVASTVPLVFKALVSQTPPVEGLPIQVELSFDANGKPLSFKAIPGGISGVDPEWTDQDAVSLLEHSLHKVLDGANDELLAPFYANLSTLTLTKIVFNEKPAARIQLTASTTSKKLNIYLKLDGTFITTELIP